MHEALPRRCVTCGPKACLPHDIQELHICIAAEGPANPPNELGPCRHCIRDLNGLGEAMTGSHFLTCNSFCALPNGAHSQMGQECCMELLPGPQRQHKNACTAQHVVTCPPAAANVGHGLSRLSLVRRTSTLSLSSASLLRCYSWQRIVDLDPALMSR